MAILMPLRSSNIFIAKIWTFKLPSNANANASARQKMQLVAREYNSTRRPYAARRQLRKKPAVAVKKQLRTNKLPYEMGSRRSYKYFAIIKP
jgi:hypothetical protein